MAEALSVNAIEGGTFVVTVSFTDEEEAAVVPTSATWTLTDAKGVVINGQEDVPIVSLDSSVPILLQGDDLQILVTEVDRPVMRLLLVKARYDSELGDDLPLNKEFSFLIDDLVNVEDEE